MNVELPRPTPRVLFLLAITFVLAAAGPAGAEEICFQVSVGGTGPVLFFHLNPSVSLTSVGRVVTLAGLVRRIVGTTVTLDQWVAWPS